MNRFVEIVGGGLAGSEAALQLADRGIDVVLHEMRPEADTAVHKTAEFAELVCSNSLKSTKAESAAGMLKEELDVLGSHLYRIALEHRVAAGGALAVDRIAFAEHVTRLISGNPHIRVKRGEVRSVSELDPSAMAVVLATGPLTSDSLSASISEALGSEYLSFYDAAAPIVMADSLDMDVLFRQSRYEDAADESGQPQGDYLNAPFGKDEYERFIDELLDADRVIAKDFESRDLFQACQPIEEIARTGRDAPRFGPLKPVGLVDPRTGRRPWAAVQLRAEDREGESYNLVGFQTNLKFGEQKRVFSMIPGLEHAEFARYGVMHRNTFIDAPRLLDADLRLKSSNGLNGGVYVAGQLGGTEGYCEAIRSGLHVALSIACLDKGVPAPALPRETVFGALIAHAADPTVEAYQPMHVNFGIIPPLEQHVRNKGQRYREYAERGRRALGGYRRQLVELGVIGA